MDEVSELEYSCTNEDLRGIVLGLDLSPDDSILAVAGSGDQAFAFLEFVRQVKAVDISPKQIEYMRQKADELKIADYDGFLTVDAVGSCDGNLTGTYSAEFAEFNKIRRRKYFSREPQRLERIRENLSNLVISEPADILEVAQTEPGFSKIYLSNAFGFENDSDARATQFLENIGKNLPPDSLIYVSNHKRLSDRTREPITFFDHIEGKLDKSQDPFDILDKNKDLRKYSFLPPELEIDKELSLRARTHEGGVWTPAVYRRVEPKIH